MKLPQDKACPLGQIVLDIIDHTDDIKLEHPGALAQRDAMLQTL